MRKKERPKGRPNYGIYTKEGVPTGSDGAPLKYGGGDADTGCYVYRLSGNCLRRNVKEARRRRILGCRLRNQQNPGIRLLETPA